LYWSAEELLAAQRFLEPRDMRRARGAERAEAYAGSAVLFHEGKWRLIKITTVQAARWWGRGTRWCTSSRTDNAFESYAAEGDLLVLLTPSGRYQFATRTREFMDAADRPAHLVDVLSKAPQPL